MPSRRRKSRIFPSKGVWELLKRRISGSIWTCKYSQTLWESEQSTRPKRRDLMLYAGERRNGETNVEGLGGGEEGVDGVLGVLLGGDVEHHEDVLVFHLTNELVVVALRNHHRVIGIGNKAGVL